MKWFWNTKSRGDGQDSKERSENLWVKCTECKEILYRKEMLKNLSVCEHCNFHFPIDAREYINLLLDKDTFEELDSGAFSLDPLKFVDKKKYKDRLIAYQKKTSLKSAVIRGLGKMNDKPVSLGVMEFRFGGGSMGTVEGEKITRVFKTALELGIPAIMVSKSGGARMQEGALSLMQMAKTSAFVAQLNKSGLPYISLLTNPTTGGVTASFAMLGDLNVAEPRALIGFAGPRVIEQTIRQKLPEGFQRSEYLLEHGMVDMIVRRQEMKEKLAQALKIFTKN